MAQVNAPRALALAILAALGCATPLLPALSQDAVPYQPALEAGWAGRYDEALRLINGYLAEHPDDHAAQLDRARFLAWSGDYAAADAALAGFGPDDAEAVALRARVLGWAGRRDAALALNAPRYAQDPTDYDTAWTQALILRQGEWPQQALAPLAAVQAAKPDAPDTRDMARAVRLPLFSSVGMPLSLYSDSDDIEIRSQGLDASIRLSDRWRLLAGATRRTHSVGFGSPFAPLFGGNSVDEDRYGAGIRFAASPDSAIELWLGRSRIDRFAIDGVAGTDAETIGHLRWQQRASDSLDLAVTLDRDRVDASPRALAVTRDGAALDLRWRPTLRDTVSARLAHDRFDDDNRRDALLASYTHAVHRGEHAMVDVGGVVELQHNSRDTGNGYYSPDHYRRVAPQVSTYLPLSSDAGLYLSAAVGVQKDETFDNWKRAVDVNAELTLGIYNRWQLVGRAGYSQRLNQFGRYEGSTIGLVLRYRFCEFRADRCPTVP